MICINTQLLDEVSQKAKAAPRMRMNFNFHQSPEERLHRMINALEPGTYVRPHKHEDPDKVEAFLVLRGKILVVEFDDKGNIQNHAVLDATKGEYGIEIPPRTFHTIASLSPGSAIYEIKDGPYNPLNDKNFAKWAPAEGDPEATTYLNELLQKLNISI